MDFARQDHLAELEGVLGYTFRERRYLDAALTHKSFIEEGPGSREAAPSLGYPHYENLEFLGDAVLQLAMTHIIMKRFPFAGEGVLSKLRSQLVSEDSLYDQSRRYDLGRFLQLGKGEEATQGRTKRSILADIYESVIGAVYLDGGFQEAFGMVERDFEERLTHLPEELHVEAFSTDFKSLLQEYCQKRWRAIPVYQTIEEWGPDHDKTFRVQVTVQGRPLGEGEGKSKKSAEQIAAQTALGRLREVPSEE